MDGYVLKEKSYFKMLEFSFSSKLDWGSYTVSVTKTASNKIGGSFFLLKLLFSCINLAYGLAWNTGWSGRVLLGAT